MDKRRDEDDGIYPVDLLKSLSKLRKQTLGGSAGKSVVEPLGGQWNGSGYNYTLLQELYSDWPLVRSAVDWAIETALENGYRTESDSEEAKTLCDGWARTVHLDDEVLPRWIQSIHLAGDVFEETPWGSVEIESGKTYSAPALSKPLNPAEMRYQRGQKGENLIWQQDVNVTPKPQWKVDDPAFLHYAWRSIGNSPFGIPIISSIIDDVSAVIRFQNQWGPIMEWYQKPFWHVKVGTPDKPASGTLLEDVKGHWEDREPNTDLITAGNITIEEHGIGANMPNPEPYLKQRDHSIVDGLESPFTHILMGATQASAEEIRENTLGRIIFIQRWLKRKLEGIFAQILLKNNIKAEVKVSFQPLRAITLKDRVDRYISILNPVQVQLDDETRIEVVNQLRMILLDMPRDNSLKLSVQPMPGQQGLIGRFRSAFAGKPTAKPPDVTSTTETKEKE